MKIPLKMQKNLSQKTFLRQGADEFLLFCRMLSFSRIFASVIHPILLDNFLDKYYNECIDK